MSTAVDWEQKAENALDAIADKLGTGIDHFWPLFIKQQWADGIISIIIFVLIMMFFILLSYISYKNYKNGPNPDTGLILTLALLATALVGLLVVYELRTGILQILNPEYYALKEIMELMK